MRKKLSLLNDETDNNRRMKVSVVKKIMHLTNQLIVTPINMLGITIPSTLY